MNMKSWQNLLDEFLIMYYDKKTFNHVKRVTEIAMSNPIASVLNEKILWTVCRCHDLLEDTQITYDQLQVTLDSLIGDPFASAALGAILSITRDDLESYSDYIKRIRYIDDNPYSYVAKLSDMKDHLLQSKTLTSKKKKKYSKAIPELL